MQWRCRQEIEDALWEAARAQLSPSALERKRLIRGIESRSALYTTERDTLLQSKDLVLSESDLAARVLFFGVSDAAKVYIPMSELSGRNALPKGDRWRVLDLGAGGGAMGLGLLSFVADHHPGIDMDVDAVDTDEAALSIYASAFQSLAHSSLDLGRLNIQSHHQSVVTMAIAEDKYDLIVLGSVLNELKEPESQALMQRALKGLREHGSLIVIEPALRETSRALHRVRDMFIKEGASIFAPCTHSQGPCPALTLERDWCHEDRPYVLPSRARQMAQSTGLRDGSLKFSYLVVRQDALPLVATEESEYALRVVSKSQRSKGQRTCYACSKFGRQNLRLLKRNRQSANRIFERVRRGDVLISSNDYSSSDDKMEIAKTQKLRLERPALPEE